MIILYIQYYILIVAIEYSFDNIDNVQEPVNNDKEKCTNQYISQDYKSVLIPMDIHCVSATGILNSLDGALRLVVIEGMQIFHQLHLVGAFLRMMVRHIIHISQEFGGMFQHITIDPPSKLSTNVTEYAAILLGNKLSLL